MRQSNTRYQNQVAISTVVRRDATIVSSTRTTSTLAAPAIAGSRSSRWRSASAPAMSRSTAAME